MRWRGVAAAGFGQAGAASRRGEAERRGVGGSSVDVACSPERCFALASLRVGVQRAARGCEEVGDGELPGRIAAVEGGDHICRAVAALIRPSSHHQRRRAAFRPHPSHLSAMSVAAAASSREGCAAADKAERRHSPSAAAARGRRTWWRGDAGAGGGISPAGRALPLPMHSPLPVARLPLSLGRRRSSPQPASASPLFFSPAGRRSPVAGRRPPDLFSSPTSPSSSAPHQVVASSPVIAPLDKEQSERKRGKERRGEREMMWHPDMWDPRGSHADSAAT
uniref:Uncharacterized protein n=1 Tax=Oryza sativa subsp. japonica TaxID=39947 RepID=Q6K485_ORYSJ|nr:hypothetical protein [Oryza sativa Japonica Group]BAD26004.1 hypothetical protein [Oryza sativa Japonica Group]